MNMAIVAIRHLNKQSSETKAIYRGIGSIASNAAARFVFLIAQHPEEHKLPEHERRRVMACTKANRIRKPPSFAFRLSTFGNEKEKNPPAHVEWITSPPCTLTANDLLITPKSPRNSEALQQAKDFLELTLVDGPVESTKLDLLAKEKLIAPATLSRARRKLKVRAERIAGKWWMSLPEDI